MREPREVWNVGCRLGEGPVWVERDQALWFTDIKKRQIHRFEPQTGARRSWDSPEQVGFVLPASDGRFIAGLQSGLHRFDPEDGSFEMLVEVEPERPSNRLNDGVVGPDGTLWFGTMDDSEREKSGAFYRYREGRLSPTGLTGIAITNGPAISPDGRTLYWVDTRERTIHACAIREDGSLGASRLFARIEEGEGYPDGPTADRDGCVWVSLYAGWETRRYAPDGELMERVRLPVANITKVAFGGPDLRTAFATTASHLLSDEQVRAQPSAGALFSFEAPAPGLPSPLIAM